MINIFGRNKEKKKDELRQMIRDTLAQADFDRIADATPENIGKRGKAKLPVQKQSKHQHEQEEVEEKRRRMILFRQWLDKQCRNECFLCEKCIAEFRKIVMMD